MINLIQYFDNYFDTVFWDNIILSNNNLKNTIFKFFLEFDNLNNNWWALITKKQKKIFYWLWIRSND